MGVLTSGVTLSSPGRRPAGRAPTPTEERDGARRSRKFPGPRGLMETGGTHCLSNTEKTDVKDEERFFMQMARDLGADPHNVVS